MDDQIKILEEQERTAGIRQPNFQQGEEPVIYNLKGQRLNHLQPGVNIINGKKVSVF